MTRQNNQPILTSKSTMTKTRSSTAKNKRTIKMKPQKIQTIQFPKEFIKLITLLHEANKIQFDFTEELLNKMENDNSTNQ
jgi:hypothetical protein